VSDNSVHGIVRPFMRDVLLNGAREHGMRTRIRLTRQTREIGSPSLSSRSILKISCVVCFGSSMEWRLFLLVEANLLYLTK
jgi:hypothetical protein